MARQSEDVAHPLLEGFHEALLRWLKEFKQVATELENRFDPNDPQWPQRLRTLIVIFAILFAAILVREGVQAWLAHP
jgi:hypothetical protein